MAAPGSGGLARLLRACGYSMLGFKAAFANEQAFRLEIYLLVPLIPLGYWIGVNGVERALLIGSLLIVPIVELLNSGVEAIVDRVGTEFNELSGRAKDVASAAVFLSIVLVCIVWMLVLGPRFLAW